MIYLEDICPIFTKGLVEILKPKTEFVLDTSLEQPAFIIPGEIDQSIQVLFRSYEGRIELEIEIYFTSKQEPLNEIPIEFLFCQDDKTVWVIFSGIRTEINNIKLITIFNQLIKNYKKNPQLEEFTIE